MTQEEFNGMLQVAIAQGLPGGYYTSKYSGEEVDALLSGKGMSILGRYDTVDGVESPVDGGHYYIGTETPYHVFTYINGNWVDAGAMQGPKGDSGQQGEKGDPFTYDDFTPEQLEALRGPKGDNGQNGSTPQRGVDYWTAEDQQTIVDAVIAGLPNGDEVSY